jgi:ABC-type Fe3+-hydroxamate transport system substrate-binding protein
MQPILRTLPLAALALLAACGGNRASDTAGANTTEVTATDNVTTSDAMVTNIDAAAPVGGEPEEEPAPAADDAGGNAL